MKYRGHTITQDWTESKVKSGKKRPWYADTVSEFWVGQGHPKKNCFKIHGPLAFGCGTFFNEAKAKDHIDYLIRNPWIPPITPAERRRMDKRLASGHPLGRDVTVEEEPFVLQKILAELETL